ncbi:MAG: hypothetical protein ACREBH_02965 [Candidatus Micrarchaeaceae archaeon]
MGILSIFGKKNSASGAAQGPPYSVSTEMIPYRMYAKTKSSATLVVKVTNLTKDVLLTSVSAETPNHLGFDEMVVSRQHDIKVGDVQPGETKELRFGLYSSVGSDPGDYTLTLTTTAHYRDYTHVLNKITKNVKVSII